MDSNKNCIIGILINMLLSGIKNKKEVFSWSFYDFANQPFTTIIVTFIYGAFFTSVIAPDEITGTVLWTQAIAITAIVASILSPVLGALADISGYRKLFLTLFTWICSIFSICLYFPKSGDVFLALSIFIIANIAFEIAHVFYNSYLSDISSSENIGKISGFAWGLGFVGGIISLLIALFLFPDTNESLSIRRINVFVGIWFFLFSAPTLLFLNDRKREKLTAQAISGSFLSLRNTFSNIFQYKQMFRFLISRLFFNDGLITIFSLGGVYAVGTIGFSFSEVMALGIALNISAAIGAFIFGYLEDSIGAKRVINISLIVLILSTLLAYFAPITNYSKQIFWIAGILIGLMVGPNQSCSRSLMARLTPSSKQNEFFGFFALTGKATSFVGPLLFGIITSYYDQQSALFVVIGFFVVGLLLFNRIQFDNKILNFEK